MFDSVESAIQDIKRGKLVVVADEDNRENEGAFVKAATTIMGAFQIVAKAPIPQWGFLLYSTMTPL